METKECFNCKEIKEIDKFYRNPDGSIRKHVCQACYGRRERAQLKLQAIEAYGSKCACCGEEHPYFLTLDHINNDGAVHREKYNEQQIYREARREGWPKDRFQLLCMNCNFAKGHFQECPHKLGITKEMAFDKLNAACFKTGKSLVNHNTSNVQARVVGRKIQAALAGLPQEIQDLIRANLPK